MLNLTLAYSNGKIKLVGDRQKRDGFLVASESSKKIKQTTMNFPGLQ